jgi:hypothetical protein
MKSNLACLFLSSTLATAAAAQTQDVGLYMDGGLLTVLYGQECGPVNCTPFVSGPVGAGETRSLTLFGAPVSFYAVALGFPGACLSIPAFDNVLLLDSPLILGFGLTSTPPFVPTPCQQGLAVETLTIPVGTPPGIVFRVQSLGVSNSGVWAFGPAIEATTI